MPALATRHTVVAVDLRGAGHSDCPHAGYEKATLAQDVHGVMETLGFERYGVCGHDVGAMVAVALAFTHREAITRLAVLDAPIPGWSGWEANLTDPMAWHFPFHMRRDVPEMLIQGREYDYVSIFFSDRTSNHGGLPHEEVEVYARAFAQPGNVRGSLEWYRAFPSDHATAIGWKQDPLAIPVLALGGDQRWGPRIVAMMQEFATDVSGGSIPECGHWVVEERPAETSEALLGFFED